MVALSGNNSVDGGSSNDKVLDDGTAVAVEEGLAAVPGAAQEPSSRRVVVDMHSSSSASNGLSSSSIVAMTNTVVDDDSTDSIVKDGGAETASGEVPVSPGKEQARQEVGSDVGSSSGVLRSSMGTVTNDVLDGDVSKGIGVNVGGAAAAEEELPFSQRKEQLLPMEVPMQNSWPSVDSKPSTVGRPSLMSRRSTRLRPSTWPSSRPRTTRTSLELRRLPADILIQSDSMDDERSPRPRHSTRPSSRPSAPPTTRTSLALRKLPTDILIQAESMDEEKEDHDDNLSMDDVREAVGIAATTPTRRATGCLQRMCLRPNWSLRTQILLSFGTVSTVSVLLVMATAITIAVVSSDRVRVHSRENLMHWARNNSGPTVRYVSEALSPKLNPEGVVQILHEAIRDRFTGYPNGTGYNDDSSVPFFDVETGRNRFPLNSTNLLRLGWQMGDENRTARPGISSGISTAYAVYFMQGSCDPEVADTAAPAYYPNCTDNHNSIATGGVVAPSSTNENIFRKAADLVPLLKAIYEFYQDTFWEVTVFFANGGSGSYATFPHFTVDQNSFYTSIGCEWMSAPNPIDPSRPIASREEIDRCRPNGTTVSSKDYNVLERQWCRDQALNPNIVVTTGPWKDALSNLTFMISGRAVYDRVTNDFIACTGIIFNLDEVERIIQQDVNIGEYSTVSLVKWDEEGTLVATQRSDSFVTAESAMARDDYVAPGVDKNTFHSIKSLVDFEAPWDPEEVRSIYGSTLPVVDGKLVSGFPVPPPPDAYDSEYQPEFMVMLSVEEDLLLQSLSEVDQAFSSRTRKLIGFIFLVGLLGLAVVVFVIFVVSYFLTEPLIWMNRVATQIVRSFGQSLDKGIDYTRGKAWFIPKTEIEDVVSEFQKMVSRFSGDGIAKLATVKPIEVKNQFALSHEFRDLYQSRKEPDFKFDYDDPSPLQAGRRHFGPNVCSTGGETEAKSLAPLSKSVSNKHLYSSRLFWWIVVTIVIPLLATTVTIAAVVTLHMSRELPSFVDVVEGEYMKRQKPMLSTAVTLRAVQASNTAEQAARDLHIFTRVAGWLLFGGIERSSSFTEMYTGADSCKRASAAGTCEHLRETPCDCEWGDPSQNECLFYDADSRYLQRQYFEGQSQDIWPNGDRNRTSFPDVAFSPNTTAWWKGVEEVPGSEKGWLAAGHETTYDRLRVISALSAVQMPLYNSKVTGKHKHPLRIGFEADGMVVGYSGCNPKHKDASFWVSSETNGASTIEPGLCPLGKYGYDSRCRDWYASSKAKSIGVGAPLSVVPQEWHGVVAGQSASLPLVDPITQEYVGTTSLDFEWSSILNSLQVENTPLAEGGFSFLLISKGGNVGEGIFIGIRLSSSSPQMSIEEVFLPNDQQDCAGSTCTHEWVSEAVLKSMQAGETGQASFSKTMSDKFTETFLVAYAPVNASSFRAENSSDFSQGAEKLTSQIFAFALVEPHRGILKSFREVNEFVENHVLVAIALLLSFIVLGAFCVIYICSRVTVSITRSIVCLLELTRHMNRLDIVDDFPTDNDIDASCREVSRIFDTMEMLYKVVRFANSAFFAGNLEQAYHVMVDALSTFKRLGNKKAIAVANNNLGNTMLTMYRTMQANNSPTIIDLTKQQIVAKGTLYFNEAISLGEDAYDRFYEEEGWSTNCLQFMQHLSNRYFNRAMFLLTVKADHNRPADAEDQGRRDLQIVQDMDIEIVDQCVEVGFSIDESEHFDLAIVRIRGLLNLMEMGYANDWFVQDIIGDAFRTLNSALKNPSSALFNDVRPAGRMQQLDTGMLRYAKLGMNDVPVAGRVGVRMLVEDDYTLANEQLFAVNALIDYLDYVDPTIASSKKRDELLGYRALLQEKQNHFFKRELFKTVNEGEVESMIYPMKNVAHKHSRRSNENLVIASAESFRGDITMEMF